ncbi:MAG: S9 family peptidase [Chloroflexi bacterium]|nr:S9 family peptidase [Chloroflexota bacterium]
MTRSFGLDDFARLVEVRDPQLSPDGRRVAVVLETVDEAANLLRRRLLVFDVARPGRRRTIATGSGKLGSPRWSPDGTRLAYLTDRRSKDGTAQLEVRVIAGRSGPPTRLTSFPMGVAAPAWSPDGEWLAFVAGGADRPGDEVPAVETDPKRRFVRVRGHRHRLEGAGHVGIGEPHAHLWIVPAAGGEARQVTGGPSDDGDPAWSPDGRSIAFLSDRSADRDRHFGGEAVHVVNVKSGRVRRLSPERTTASLPAWSPDGRSIAYLRSDSPNRLDGHHNRLWVVSVRSGDETCWSAGEDRSVGTRPGGYTTPSRPVWAADSSAIVGILADAGTAQLARFTPGRVERLTDDAAVIEEIASDRSGGRAVLLRTDPVTPSELWSWEQGGAPRRLAGFNDDLIAVAAPRRPARRTVARPDGLRVDGWLTVPGVPRGRRLHPLVVSVHGGPHNAFGERFGEDLQLLVAAGYAVLQVNPRGSGSYDESFARAVVGDWGGADFEDILAMLDDALADRSLRLDPGRVAITGGSYGGFMACWAITQTDRFAVAIAGAPIVNFESEYGTADIGPTWFEREQLGTPWADRERYAARSAIRLVERVRTPLLLYHGEADLRCPIEQSEQFFSALVALGREVELVRVPAEGHVLPSDASPVHRRMTREVILEWFGRYLKPGA